MGREVKRVPMDFDWPIGEVWAGYLISTCQSDTIGCDKCRHAARLQGMAFTRYNCPDSEPMTGPPKGDGWQMWETTSEGSPISPVCESPEALAKWLAGNNAPAFGRQTATYEQWLKMIQVGWAPSAVVDANGMRSGVAALS